MDRGFLFGIAPLDPITFGAVVAVLALTGTLSTLRRPCERHASIRSSHFELISKRAAHPSHDPFDRKPFRHPQQ
jgi:hypothetical protein